jgi:COP9 signalosome complex subunit 2
MLMKSDINPFDSQETKPYKNDPRISAMTDLVDAYQRDEIHRYEKILHANQDLLADPFIAENIDEVTRNMRTKAILKLIAPYTRFTLDFISNQLKIPHTEVQNILGYLIVDKQLRGKIDQRSGTVEIESRMDMERVNAVHEWSKAIGALWSTILNDGDGFRQEESAGGFNTLGPVAPGHPKVPNGGAGRMKVSSKGKFMGSGKLGNVLR